MVYSSLTSPKIALSVSKGRRPPQRPALSPKTTEIPKALFERKNKMAKYKAMSFNASILNNYVTESSEDEKQD